MISVNGQVMSRRLVIRAAMVSDAAAYRPRVMNAVAGVTWAP
jgi:hypothetical protein